MIKRSRKPAEESSSSFLFGPGVETLWKRKKGRRSGLTSVANLPSKIVAELGQAEMLYVNGEIQPAIDLLSSVSRQAPRLSEPYNILGLIYEESGDFLRALQLYALAASFTPKSIDLWKKVALYAGMIGEYDQAIAACNRCYRLEPRTSYLSQKIIFLLRSRRTKNAREGLRSFLTKHPDELAFLIDFGDETDKIGMSEAAISVFLRYIFHWLGSDCITNDLLHSMLRHTCERKSLDIVMQHLDDIFYAVRRTVDILLQKMDGLQPSIDLLQIIVDVFQSITDQLPYGAIDVPLFPMDLSLLLGICKLQLLDETHVEVGLSILNPILKRLEDCDLDSEGNVLVPGAENILTGKEYYSSDSEDDEHVMDVSTTVERQKPPKDLTSVVSSALSDLSLFFMRQRVRMAEIFVSLGMLTRAEKVLSALSCHLRNVDMMLVKVDIEQRQSGLFTVFLMDEPTKNVLGIMWRDIGNAFCVLNKEENAYAAFSRALEHNESDVEALSRYAELTRIHFPDNSVHVCHLLSTHFKNVVQEFESFCNVDNPTEGPSEVFPEANSSSVNVKLRSTASNKSLASSQRSVHFQASQPVAAVSVAATAVTSVSGAEVTAESSLPCEVEGEDYDLLSTFNENNTEDVSCNNDINLSEPLNVTLEDDANYDDLDDDFYGNDDVTAAGSEVSEGGLTANSLLDDEDNDYEGVSNNNNQTKRNTGDNSTHKEKYTNRTALHHQLYALTELAHCLLLVSEQDHLAYCTIALPLLEHWCFTVNRGANEGYSVMKRRKQKKPVMSLSDVATTDSVVNYQNKFWLNGEQNAFGKLIGGWCDFLNIEKLLGKDVLFDLAQNVVPKLVSIDLMIESSAKGVLTELSVELMRACTLRHLKRRSRPGVAEFTVEGDVPESEDDSSDSEDDTDDPPGGAATAAGVMRLSTKKRKLSTLKFPGRKRKHVVRMTGVNGGLMFNDFKSAQSLERDDVFLAAAHPYSEAVKTAAKKLLDNPDDIVGANILFRQVIAESSMIESPIASKFLENIFPVGRLCAVNAHWAVSSLLHGHDYLKMKRRNADSLERYVTAFCAAPTQPLVLLCLSTLLIVLSNHSHIKHRQDVLMKGILFLHRYTEIRKKQKCPVAGSVSGETLSEVALLQETYYNLGRALQEIQLYHLAVNQYNLALSLADTHPALRQQSLSVTHEAAHNLILIYKRSESFDLALEVMTKYLSFE